MSKFSEVYNKLDEGYSKPDMDHIIMSIDDFMYSSKKNISDLVKDLKADGILHIPSENELTKKIETMLTDFLKANLKFTKEYWEQINPQHRNINNK